ncbi:hypothetical protein [Alkalisalibacterium limincola]|uniref:hypothetical protein n=1 Tax=Alkalisalibacterium limincola TaxID=2699169 RepID=UPI00164EF716|nr:hypothetical protein [Alkalisalibacterium limincola]
MSPPRRRALAALFVLLVGVLALLAWRPELALEAEFARQRAAAGADRFEIDAAGHRWSVLASGPNARRWWCWSTASPAARRTGCP